ncbi:glycosyltransferase family A protein [Ferrimonas pelagia]|uniref:Glycosyltransferase family A protein n=1 Tax=Ferrimonas pelagia TaxID=1177826 RepID=A0ABP9F6D2_9GAMM
MPDLELITVVITTYNRPDQLLGALHSVAEQDHPNIEVVVIDDASERDYREVLAAAPIPLRYVRLERNGGACRARNRGIREAQGSLIAFLDDDDRWVPAKLSRQVTALADGEACLCGYLRSTGRVHLLERDTIDAQRLYRHNRICGTSGLLVRRTVMQELWFDEALPNAQDWDLYLRLALRQPLRYVREPLMVFNDGGHERITNRSRQQSHKQLLDRLKAVEKHRPLIGESNYRRRVAGTLMAYWSQRNDRARVLWLCIKYAGWRATAGYMVSRLYPSTPSGD